MLACESMRGLALVLVAAVAGGAAADDGAEPKLVPAKPAARPADHLGLSHKGQIEASLRLALGLRAIAPYHDEFCGQTDTSANNGQAAVCTGRSPFSLDFELGYGAARKIDVFLELRIGLESDFGARASDPDSTHIFHLSPGARFFFSDSGTAKLFTTAQAVFDFSGYQDAAGQGLGADVGLRNLNGLWFDLDRAYGLYVFVGETLTMARWLRFELEGGVGIQGRYR
jgi:hypothetical protein